MTEPTEHTLAWRCRCGSVTGSLHHRPYIDRHFHAICHCRDCQAFPHLLGCAEQVLDANGGTAILGVSPAAFRIDTGHDELAVIRLSEKGLLRWHTRCCDTPIGHTASSRSLPHLGIIAATVAHANGQAALEAVYGPVRERIYGRSAPGGSAPGAHPRVPLSMLPSMLAMFAGRVRRGEHKRSALFDDAGEPIVIPRVLGDDERAALAPYRR